jgi:hypothetical protein
MVSIRRIAAHRASMGLATPPFVTVPMSFSFMMALFAFHRGTQQFGEQIRNDGFFS